MQEVVSGEVQSINNSLPGTRGLGIESADHSSAAVLVPERDSEVLNSVESLLGPHASEVADAPAYTAISQISQSEPSRPDYPGSRATQAAATPGHHGYV